MTVSDITDVASPTLLYLILHLFTFVRRLPIGIAGLLACCFGIAGAVVGMSQVWYTGPIGKMAGATFGADLGFEVRQRVLDITELPF